MLLASFFFSLMNVLVKFLPHIPAVEIAFFRALVSLGLSFVILKRLRIPLMGNRPASLLMRGFFGAGALILYFITLQQMPLASAVTIQFLSPIFTTILGLYLVKEKVFTVQWFFFLMAFAGVLLIQGFDTRVTPLYLMIGIGSAFFSGLAYNTIRKIKDSEHPMVIVFYFPLVTVPIAGIAMAWDFVWPSGWDWAIIFLIGFFTQIAQYYMTRAYQSDEISKVASIKYIGIIYALIFGYFIFDEAFTLEAHIGMLVVLAGVVGNVWYKHFKSKEEFPNKTDDK
jgi:drug/metabolite transporter (DMT)-like permease